MLLHRGKKCKTHKTQTMKVYVVFIVLFSQPFSLSIVRICLAALWPAVILNFTVNNNRHNIFIKIKKGTKPFCTVMESRSVSENDTYVCVCIRGVMCVVTLNVNTKIKSYNTNPSVVDPITIDYQCRPEVLRGLEENIFFVLPYFLLGLLFFKFKNIFF